MQKRIIIVIAIISVVGVLVWYFLYRNKATTGPGNGSGGGGGTGPEAETDPETLGAISFPLTFYEKGREALYLQKFLNQMQGAGLSEDAIYGPNTNRAWKDFLATTGDYADFEIDGVVAVYKDQYNDYVKPSEDSLT